MRSRAGQIIQRAKGGGRYKGRDPFDFWPTPAECTIALMRFLAVHESWALQLGRQEGVLEPACGDGAIARVLEAMGFPVTASDLIDRGYGTGWTDFMTITAPRERMLITNPPYGDVQHEAFIRHAAQLRRLALVALLLPAGFWYADRRLALFDFWRPAWNLPLAWRPDFTGGGNSPMQLQWVVWSRAAGNAGQSRTVPLPWPEPAPDGEVW